MIYYKVSYYLIAKIKANEDIFLHYDKSPVFVKLAGRRHSLRVYE